MLSLQRRPESGPWPGASGNPTAEKSRFGSIVRAGPFLIKWILGVAAVFAVIRFNLIDFGILARQARNPAELLCALSLVLITYPLSAQRWRLLLAEGDVSIRFLPALEIIAISAFAALFLPGSVTADAVRMGYTVPAAKGRRVAAIASVVVDRGFGLAGLVALAAILSLRSSLIDRWPQGWYLLWGTIAACLVSVAALAAVWRLSPVESNPQRNRFISLIAVTYTAFARLLRRPRLLVTCLLLSIVIQAALLGSIAAVGVSMKFSTLGSLDFALAGAVALLANVVPLTPGGIGIGETAFAAMCSLLAGTSAAAFGNAFLLYRMISAVTTLLGLWALLRHRTPSLDRKG